MFRRIWNCLAASVIALSLGVAIANAQNTANVADSSHIQFLKEFIRELEVLYRLQETAKKEFAEDGSANGKMMTSIRVGTRTVMEMITGIGMLNSISLDGQWNKFRTTLVEIDSNRASTIQEMNEIAKKMLRGPEPGVNYGALTARAPELTAIIEQLDKLMFDMSKVLSLSLIDNKRVDADGKLRHLLVSRQDRTDIIRYIDIAFGERLEDKNATYIVTAAWAIKLLLTNSEYKSADEI